MTTMTAPLQPTQTTDNSSSAISVSFFHSFSISFNFSLRENKKKTCVPFMFSSFFLVSPLIQISRNLLNSFFQHHNPKQNKTSKSNSLKLTLKKKQKKKIFQNINWKQRKKFN